MASTALPRGKGRPGIAPARVGSPATQLRAGKAAFLQLHAALDADQLWTATEELVHQLIPCSSRWLCLGTVRGSIPLLVLRSSGPGAPARRISARRSTANQDTAERQLAAAARKADPVPAELFTLHPAVAHFRSNAGVRTVRLADLWPDVTPKARARFHRTLARPLGWKCGAAAALWKGDQLEGVLLLHRDCADDFTDAEMELLQELQPHLQTALQRVLGVRQQLARDDCLAQVLHSLPLALVLCDARLNVIYENAAGLQARAEWLMGAGEARAVNLSRKLPLPDDVADHCRRSVTLWEEKLPASHRSREVVTSEMQHPSASAARVRVSMIRRKAFPLIKPMFLLQFAGAPGPKAAPLGSEAHLAEMARLSPRERELAALVCDGYSNLEISTQLGKSVRTIKTQMHSIFGKLDVSSRGRLISLLCRLLPIAALLDAGL